ncbi:MAG: hypothetical protein VX663_10075, partial [Pseudomonadota bacterium]|nr:hypothetical protein [Pseudomonadota bacterium]
MKFPCERRTAIGAGVVAAALLLPQQGMAGGTIKIDDTKWVSVGAGLRTSFTSVEDGAISGDDDNDFNLESVRLYLNGQIHKYLKLEFNTDYDGANDVNVLDAVAKVEFNDYLNVWMGRHLPPSDRANLDGPYYLNNWNFPFVQAYPAIFAGRDNGIMLNGQVDGGRFKYALGAYEGNDDFAGTGSNPDDKLLYAARFSYSFLDPEPGFYTSSTYYGSKDIFTVAVALQSQKDGTGFAATPGDFFGWSVDVLYEKPIGNGGAFSLEGAYYDYDHDEVPAFGYDGDGYYALASYLTQKEYGFGRLQPHVRYLDLSSDTDDLPAASAFFVPDLDMWEAGLGYIIDGHNARATLTFGE